MALTPFGQTGVYSFLYVSGIILKTCSDCGCIKPHPLKNCPPLVSSSSAHMLSEEHEIARTICRGQKTLHTHIFKGGKSDIRQTTHHTPVVTGCPHFYHHSVMILKHERWQVEELNTHHTDTCTPTMHYHPHTRTHTSTTAHTHKLRTAEVHSIQHNTSGVNKTMKWPEK